MGRVKTEMLTINGMTCAGCAGNVERALTNCEGVSAASVNFGSAKASVTFDEARISRSRLEEAVRAAGYKVVCSSSPDATTPWWKSDLVHTFGIGLFLLVGWQLGYLHVVPHLVSTAWVAVATVIASVPIFRRAIRALWNRSLDADVLVAMGITGAATAAIFEGMKTGHFGHLVAAGEVAFIMLLGEHLEHYTVERCRRNVGSLLALAPQKARVQRDGREIELLIGEVARGDRCIVRPGEKLPVDGVVVSGESLVNQATITGESMPVGKKAGDAVFGGTINGSGALMIEATAVGEDSTLARITRLVEEAQEKQAPIQRVCDRYAKWVVPLMLVLSAGTYLFTQDLQRAMTVLIVACPCALVLATPTAVIAGIARAAREGILIKGGQYLEAAAKLNVIVFDKTGTLTTGRHEVAHVHSFDEHGEAEVVGLAAVAEKLSEHPVAHAILRKAGALKLDVASPTSFRSHAGRGVEAHHNGQRILVGHSGLMTDHQVELSDQFRAHAEQHQGEGHTTLMVAHNGKTCGTICVSDQVRDRAEHAVADLKRLGIEKVVMLTGDNRRVAMSIAGKVGIDDVAAEVMPEQKAARIATFKANGHRVAMVGDGVNDAPALATADVGMAMGVTGSDVAHEAAHIALMADDLSKVAFAVGLSRQTIRLIKQGLIFALVYNVIMITTAIEGHLGLIGGAIAHQISSVIVILNSMRLLRYSRS